MFNEVLNLWQYVYRCFVYHLHQAIVCVVAMVCIHILCFALYHWASNYRKPDFGLSKKLFSDCMIWIEHV